MTCDDACGDHGETSAEAVDGLRESFAALARVLRSVAEALDDWRLEEAQAQHQHWQRRERKLQKAKARMPMHGKHLLRDHRKGVRGLR